MAGRGLAVYILERVCLAAYHAFGIVGAFTVTALNRARPFTASRQYSVDAGSLAPSDPSFQIEGFEANAFAVAELKQGEGAVLHSAKHHIAHSRLEHLFDHFYDEL